QEIVGQVARGHPELVLMPGSARRLV
ncbi:MAG: hypothetical protein ACJAVJ_001022, partial [Planctomycetota bacterium]